MQSGGNKGDWIVWTRTADSDKTGPGRKDEELSEKSRRVLHRQGRGLPYTGEQGGEAGGRTYMKGADGGDIGGGERTDEKIVVGWGGHGGQRGRDMVFKTGGRGRQWVEIRYWTLDIVIWAGGSPWAWDDRDRKKGSRDEPVSGASQQQLASKWPMALRSAGRIAAWRASVLLRRHRDLPRLNPALLRTTRILDPVTRPYSSYIICPLTSLLPPHSNMVLPHHTPYVTPHILHKHYAQAAEAEQHSNRMSPARAPTPTHH